MKTPNKPRCCQVNGTDKNNEVNGMKQGLMYGLIPHIGCIAFIIFSIIGVTTATAFFRPLLVNKYLFYGLLALSFVFAAISASIYLKRHNMLSMQGIKAKKSYLTVLFCSTIFVNLLFFFVIFPYAANAGIAGSITAGTGVLTIAVDIPCSGHASLITGDIKAVHGVAKVEFSLPNKFIVYYDTKLVSEQDILNIEIFKTYTAIKVIS